MITNIIVDYIDTQFDSLTKSVNLFAENAPMSKCVYAKLQTTTNINKMNPHFRKSYINLYVKGYGINDGVTLCNSLLYSLEDLKGAYTFSTEQYEVIDTAIHNFPFFEYIDDSKIVLGSIVTNYYIY